MQNTIKLLPIESLLQIVKTLEIREENYEFLVEVNNTLRYKSNERLKALTGHDKYIPDLQEQKDLYFSYIMLGLNNLTQLQRIAPY